MNIRKHERLDVLRSGPRTGSAAGSVDWGRLGLAAILGLVAGTILCPTPAKGWTSTDRDRA
jgi:hypothetical protein